MNTVTKKPQANNNNTTPPLQTDKESSKVPNQIVRLFTLGEKKVIYVSSLNSREGHFQKECKMLHYSLYWIPESLLLNLYLRF